MITDVPMHSEMYYECDYPPCTQRNSDVPMHSDMYCDNIFHALQELERLLMSPCTQRSKGFTDDTIHLDG